MGVTKKCPVFSLQWRFGEQYASICYFVFRPLEIYLETCFEEQAKGQNIKSN